MAKPSMMVKMAQEMCRQLVAEQTKTRLALGCDAAIIAANKVFHMGPGRAAAFAQAYSEAMNDLAGLYLDDARENRDASIDYAKGKRDALIRKIVGEDNFVPFDRFYAPVYIDELRRVRALQPPEADTSSGLRPPSPQGEGNEKDPPAMSKPAGPDKEGKGGRCF